jgi:di/tricarboxylate transporter
MVEVILLPRSPLIGRTLETLGFRQRYGLQVLGINRRGEAIFHKLSQTRLKIGDQLLFQGPRTNIAVLDEDNTFHILGAVDEKRPNRQRAPMAIAIFAGVLALAAFNMLSLPVAVLLGTLMAFVTRCITPGEAYREVGWRALIVIGSMLALGSAMDYTGTAEFLAAQVAGLTNQAHTTWLLSGFFFLTMLLTQPMSNQAAAVVVIPIALQTALQLGVNPRTFAIMIAVGASCSFITPLEPACLMVYGPGRYRFMDFVKVGALLTVLVYILAIVLVPWIWPL